MNTFYMVVAKTKVPSNKKTKNVFLLILSLFGSTVHTIKRTTKSKEQNSADLL